MQCRLSKNSLKVISDFFDLDVLGAIQQRYVRSSFRLSLKLDAELPVSSESNANFISGFEINLLVFIHSESHHLLVLQPDDGPAPGLMSSPGVFYS